MIVRILMNNKGTIVTVKDGEDINRALRRLKNKVEDAGNTTKSQLQLANVKKQQVELDSLKK